MKIFITCTFMLFPLFSEAQYKGKWKQMFIGKSLKGWTVKISKHELDDNFANTFRVPVFWSFCAWRRKHT